MWPEEIFVMPPAAGSGRETVSQKFQMTFHSSNFFKIRLVTVISRFSIEFRKRGKSSIFQQTKNIFSVSVRH